MIHIFEAVVFVAYSFLAAIITAGGGMIVSNVLSLADIDLIKATGLTSSFFLVNAFIVVAVFWKDIVWSEIQNIFPVAIVGAFIGALFLVNINPIILLILMFGFSLNFIYKKVRIVEKKAVVNESKYKKYFIGLLSGAISASALPGGGFLNSYFASKGYTLHQMFGTLNLILIMVWVVKVSVMLNSGILAFSDFTGVAIAFPFLVISNTLMRRGLITLPKSTTDKITIFAMVLFSLYALVTIILNLLG